MRPCGVDSYNMIIIYPHRTRHRSLREQRYRLVEEVNGGKIDEGNGI
jgi:hypothetical protein